MTQSVTHKPQVSHEGLRARLNEEVSIAAVTGLSTAEFVCRSTDNTEIVKDILAQVLADLHAQPDGPITFPAVSVMSGRQERRRAPDPLSEHGCIERQGDIVVVRKAGDARLLKQEGVTCENPEDPEPQRIYRKEFKNKQIYLPDELDKARQENLKGKDTFIMGMTGYSSIGEENCKRLGITEDAYVSACSDILGNAIQVLQKEFPGIKVKLLDGASNMGVDKAAIEVGEHLNLETLGFSCPRFMFYVEDDNKPVYVAATQSDYSLAFIRSLDLLFSVGGRLQALKFDMLAAVDEAKRIVRLNVLKAISPYGGLPARDSTGKIEDATTAFEEAILCTAPLNGIGGEDFYSYLRDTAADASILVARKQLNPERAYGRWQRGAD